MNLRAFLTASLLCALPALGQGARPGSSSFAFNLGWNMPMGDFDKVAENGYTGSLDWTYNVSSKFALRTELGRAENNIDASQFLNVTDFSASVVNWNLTENFIYTFNPDSKVNVYLIGGLGAARSTVEVGAYSYYGTVWYPWWGYTPVYGYNEGYTDTTTKLTYNAGLGVQFKFSPKFAMSLESRYTWISTEQQYEYVPIAIGFRFM